MDKDSQQKTAFVTHWGLYEFLCMPFGLTNAPATFRRLIQTVLSGLTWEICPALIDDIIVFGRTYAEHRQRLEIELQRLSDGGLKLKAKKCSFLHKEVKFLGHVVSEHGITADPDNIMIRMG